MKISKINYCEIKWVCKKCLQKMKTLEKNENFGKNENFEKDESFRKIKI